MIRPLKIFAMTILLVTVCCRHAEGQAAPASILVVDVDNIVQYHEDISDVSKFATNPNITPAVIPKNFHGVVIIGDIVAVNGQPARGTVTRNVRMATLTRAPNPGVAIADTVHNGLNADAFEILKADGTPIGAIMGLGLGGGDFPAGAPLALTGGNLAIVGGTGAFLGARGQEGTGVAPQGVPSRQASFAEDPANRRRNGGGRARFILQVIPLFLPEIINTTYGPAVVHSSTSTLVYAFDPAASAERLRLFATGLGSVVNSPVEVIVNGQPAEVLGAAGVPSCPETISRAHTTVPATVVSPVDAENCYQIDFRLPAGVAGETATIQLRAAFIAGREASISTR
jgi:hypothetical protein